MAELRVVKHPAQMGHSGIMPLLTGIVQINTHRALE